MYFPGDSSIANRSGPENPGGLAVFEKQGVTMMRDASSNVSGRNFYRSAIYAGVTLNFTILLSDTVAPSHGRVD